jgi:hypothetical protein
MNRKAYTLALLRSAAAKARLISNDIDFIGVSLECSVIGPDQAMQMLADAGGASLVLEAPSDSAEAA